METLTKIDRWSETHPYTVFGLLRIALGVGLFYKGLTFAGNTPALQQMLANSQLEWVSLSFVHYVVMAHLVGGVLITIGLLTRVAAVVQLPILLAAVIFVNAERGFFSIHSELIISIVFLLGLIFYSIYGSGPLSMDRYMRKHPDF